MKKLLTIILFAVISFASDKDSSSHLGDVSIKENIINEVLESVKTTGSQIDNIEAKGEGKPLEEEIVNIFQTGVASFYGERWNNRKTASGEIFNTEKLTAAHKTLPFGTKVKVTNLNNGKSVVVKINDRGPFIKGRVIDLSKAAFREIETIGKGVTKVNIEILDK